MEALSAMDVPLLESAELFDIYEDEALGADRKSLAYSLTYRSTEGTLTDDEVNEAQEKVRARLVKLLDVELR
jgi:phenylalanyl-tRNA synthetase beta chain